VFIKGWTNHGVWKLMNAGNVQWEKLMETSQERKKLPLGTNINSWNEAFNLIAREKRTKQPV